MKVLQIHFASTCNNLLKHSISPEYLLIESLLEGVVRKELLITLFVELYNRYFGKVLLRNFAYSWNNLLKHCTAAEYLLIQGFVQGALRKELSFCSFVERPLHSLV